MAAPTVHGVSALATGTTSVTPTMPTVSAGDVILVIGECANGLPATPSGYSLLFSRNQLDEAGVDTNLAIYAKLAAGGDADPTLTGGSMANHGIFGIITISDHGVSDVTTDIVVATGNGDATAGSGKVANGITVTADSLIVACFGDSADQLTGVWSNATNANLTGITTRLDGNTNTANGGGTFVFTGACAGTSTGSSTADLAATTRDGWNSTQLGIPPAAAGGATATPSTVAAVASVPSPAVSGTAVATPSTVAAVASVPAPSARGAAIASPSTVAAVASVPAPAVSGTAVATPSTVAAVAAVPAPTVQGAAIVQPTTVAAVAAVPAPTIDIGGNATATPATVAAIASVPAPSVAGEARATPTTVAAVASVPAPTVAGAAVVIPGTVAAFTTVPSPTVIAVGGVIHEAETVLVGVAHMGFDPDHQPRPLAGYPVRTGSFYPTGNRRRVRTANPSRGGRIIS